MATQQERFKAILLAMKPDVTEGDKRKATSKFGYHLNTLLKYLHGNGPNNDTSLNLITFFRECIAERDRIVGEMVPSEPDKQLVA